MYFLQDTWYVFVRHLKATWRMPVWVVFTLVQPLFWLLLFGQLFKNMASMPGFPTRSYLEFFAPGVVVMTAFFGATWSGMGVLVDIDYGILERTLVTPVTRVSLILGRILASLMAFVVQAFIIFCAAWAMGMSVATGLSGVMGAMIYVALLGAGFAGLSNALALVFKKHDPLIVTLNFLTMPLMFLSSVMMPSQLAPAWIRAVSQFNPVNYATEAVRSLVVGGAVWNTLALSAAVLALFASVMMAGALQAFRRATS